ncbi:hypothetical protein BWQ96_09797 [Gracilariopsis chorda]|uniref:Uncharacterized protein n=1 Tax=Gracilariopsis chorda TaxID=448386 RepID=A0A2V3IEI2_9FLOR|nr:hypothetical protein BWQ96_09797 [Gracilariopsis chorda]|eukprot:PXF40474.1 hypothetical protein BWQ96_09797 [Gracilariopsis chorda]
MAVRLRRDTAKVDYKLSTLSDNVHLAQEYIQDLRRRNNALEEEVKELQLQLSELEKKRNEEVASLRKLDDLCATFVYGYNRRG